MARDFMDYSVSTTSGKENKDVGVFRDLPLTIELSFKNKDKLKREIWDNARKHGWLS